MIGLWTRFFVTVFELTRTQRAYLTDTAHAMRVEHDRRVAERAERTRLAHERLRELCALQSRPIGTTFRGVLASVMLDRLALSVGAVLLLAALALLVRLGPLAGYGWHGIGVVAALAVVMHFYLAAGRGSVSPAKHMTDRAARISRIFPAPFVVMGHTHVPLSVRAGEATYINVGSWSEEDDPSSSYRAARTHAVIHEREGKPEARLYEWHPEVGPRLRG
jgi:hypothetical protein